MEDCLFSDQVYGCPAENHEKTEKLAHGQGTENEPELSVGLPEKFDDQTHASVTDNIEGEQKPVEGALFAEAPEHGEEKQTFEESLVKLRGVPEPAGRVEGKIHAPGDRGRPSVKFSVDEIADPAEGVSQGDGRADEIGEIPEIDPVSAAEENRREEDAEDASVIGHAADPDKSDTSAEIEGQKNFQGMLQVVLEVVKKNVAEPCSQDQSGDDPDEGVLDHFHRVRISFCPDAVGHQKIGEKEGDNVHEAVIAELKESDLKKVGTGMRGEMLPEMDQGFHNVPFRSFARTKGRAMTSARRSRTRR